MGGAPANGWGGPQAGGPNGSTSDPDWAALADRHERERRRRRQLRVIGGAVAAVLVVGGVTALAVTHTSAPGTPSGNSAKGGPAASATGAAADGGDAEPVDVSAAPGSPSAGSPSAPSGSAAPSSAPNGRASGKASAGTSAGAPADPLAVISAAAATDTAPLDPAALFADHLTVGGHSWTRLATATTSPCWKATTGGLGDVLAAQGCRAMLRATYTFGSSAVTVGIAVTDSRGQADAAAAGHHGQVQGLVPSGHTSYCVSAGCANTHGSVGRYDYYTVAGTVQPGGNTADAAASAAQTAFAGYARAQLLARGRR
ncbi:hypothetical protein [Kitasatospora sp. NPDC059571]|uniref:hypothetical protein n=1 Tax=Kitasatospora sp. NPDC059571 TaxID=3346871 RepID=UPI00367ACE76